MLYGANVARPEQRSIGNVKKGDIAFVWVPNNKDLYGIFEVEDRIYYDESDIGWDGDWPYRCRLKMWDGYLRKIPVKKKAQLMSFISSEMVTFNDLMNLGGYIHTLIYEEGVKLMTFYMANSEKSLPHRIFPSFASHPSNEENSHDFKELLSNSMAEYILEMYLLHNKTELEKIVGSGVSEIYNTISCYQNRYLDILTIHKDRENNPFKYTVIELKTNINKSILMRAIDEVAAYMFWVSDQINKNKLRGSSDFIHGIIISRDSRQDMTRDFIEYGKKYTQQYDLDLQRLSFITYKVENGELCLTTKF